MYLVGPTPTAINNNNNFIQIWVNTGIPQPAGVGNWSLFYQLAPSGSASSGGGDGGGSGGGDGGDG